MVSATLLKNSEYAFSTKVNNSKYEIFVDKNIYEESKILLKLNNDNTKNEITSNNENQRKDFLYFVNQFFKMLGLDNTYPYVWANRGRIVTSQKVSLLKKIQVDAEQSLASVMLGGKDNPVKYLALGNHYYGWNERRIETDTRERRTLSLEELPKYELEKKSDNLQLPNFDDDDD